MQKPLKKVKKQARKPRSPSPITQEPSESHTQSNILENDLIQNEVKDTTATSEPPTTTPILTVSTPPTSIPIFDFF